MTKRQAQKALETLLTQIDKRGQPDEYWLEDAHSLFKSFFGEDSIHYKNLAAIRYDVVNSGKWKMIITQSEDDARSQFRQVLNKAIEKTKEPLFQPLENLRLAAENPAYQQNINGIMSTANKVITFIWNGVSKNALISTVIGGIITAIILRLLGIL